MNQTTVLVVGATGKVGSALVKNLLAKEIGVKALVRDVEKARNLFPREVELCRGDLEDSPSIAQAIQGADKVFLSTPNRLSQVDVEKNIIDLSKKAGVAHIVKLSGGSAHEASPARIARWHGEAERYLERSGISYTHLQPEFFMQNLLGFSAQIAQGTLSLPLGNAPMGLVDANDIGAVAANILTGEGHAGKTCRITGPEALNADQLASVFTRILGHQVVYVPLSAESFVAQLQQMGVPEWSATALAEVFIGVAAGNANFTTDVVERVGQRAANTFEDFVKQHQAVFNQQVQVAG
jgi:uncharacterized protein YbjT (DUF2867 family)